MSVNPVFPAVFNGGQMTDLPRFTGTLDGTELMEIVAAPAGEGLEAAGVNYGITTQQLAELLIVVGVGQTVILSDGQHTSALDPYIPTPLVSRIYINKIVAEPTYIAFNAAVTYLTEPLVKDIAGTVDAAGNGVFVAFHGVETADGLAAVPITAAYGGYFFRPIASLQTWTLGVS